MFRARCGRAGALLVNRSGERFADELADDASLSEALLTQPGRCGWLIFGEGLLHLLPSALEERTLSGADPEKLSRAAGLPAEALEETISDRNAELPEAADEEGNEPHPARLEGELYALEVAPGVKTTLGGLAITPEAEVLGAAGEPDSGALCRRGGDRPGCTAPRRCRATSLPGFWCLADGRGRTPPAGSPRGRKDRKATMYKNDRQHCGVLLPAPMGPPKRGGIKKETLYC